MQVVMSVLYVRIYGVAEHQAVCSAAFMIPSSRLAKTTANTKAEVSAIGPAYMTPSIPKKNGKMTISGSRNSPDSDPCMLCQCLCIASGLR